MSITSHRIRFARTGYIVAAGFATALTLTASARSGFADAPNPLASAKTIEVHETIQTRGANDKLVSAYDIDLRIARPGQINALLTMPGVKLPYQYVDDGKTEREYLAKSNAVRTVAPRTDGKSHSIYRGYAQADMILNNGRLTAPKAGAQRIVSEETVNGIPMTVTTDVLAPATNGHDDVKSVVTHRLWTVTATGLPFRYAIESTANGKSTPIEYETFTDWKFDQPLAPSQLAFAPPADAKPYVEPTFEMTTLKVGAMAPDFTAVTADGKAVHLSDFKGKTVVLDFWATWCHPCLMSMAHLESVYRQIKDQNVAVLAMCVWDAKDSYTKWVADTKYTFPTAYDPAGRAMKAGERTIAGTLYNLNAIPGQYVIDKTGKIAAVFVGYDEGDRKLENALAAQGVTLTSGNKTAAAHP